MKPRSSVSRLLSELLRAMAMCDPYCYSYVVSLGANPSVGSGAPTVQKAAAITGSALSRRSWTSSTQR